VREWRNKLGLTQEQLAGRTPFSPGAISQLETGRTAYTQPMLEAISNALGVEPGDLISRNPYAEGDVIYLFNDLSEDKKRIAIEMLKALKTA
jgi:transcriptional regulator with XRE-family HTH domain